MVKFTYSSQFRPIKSPENSFFQQNVQGEIPKKAPAKMVVAQGYSDVEFLRGGHLSCHF